MFWFYECSLLNNLGFQPSLEDPDLPGLVLPEIKNDTQCIIILSTLLTGEINQLQDLRVSKKTGQLISNYLWSLLDYHFEELSKVKSFWCCKKIIIVNILSLFYT